MATVSFDSAFMKQILPSTPIDYAKDIFVVRDQSESARSLVFSIGSDDQLFLLRPQKDHGITSVLNLHSLLGLAPNARVSKLAVSQGRDFSIYIVFAVNAVEAGESAKIYVMVPTKPDEWLDANESTDFSGSHFVPNPDGLQVGNVKRLYIAVRNLLVISEQTWNNHSCAGGDQ